MRKTLLSVAACMCLAVTGTSAMEQTSLSHNLTDTYRTGVNPFCKAIMQGDLATVQRMIELGEDVNQKSLGMTPAIFAARYNKAEILQVLIDHGADLSLKCDKGYTAKKYANLSNATDALNVLENSGKS